MDQKASVTGVGKKTVTTPMSKCGDLGAAKGPLTMHQAVLIITVFGHHIRNVDMVVEASSQLVFVKKAVSKLA